MPWEEFELLGCGRVALDDVRDRIRVTGDVDLAERVLANLNVAP